MRTKPNTLLDPKVVIDAASKCIRSILSASGSSIFMCEDDVKEIVGQVCLNVYEHQYSYNPQLSGLRTWVSRITLNTYLNFLRKRKYKAQLASNYAENWAYSNSTTSPAETYDLQEAIAKLKEYGSGLTGNKKKIFELLLEETPNQDIAAECSMSESAANTCIFRLRKELKDRFPHAALLYGCRSKAV
jgi:RNA polymerase sigma factor (sigma-70 family)